MKAFRFRLESFLHLRSLTREKCLKEYAQAIEERQRQEAEAKRAEEDGDGAASNESAASSDAYSRDRQGKNSGTLL